MLSEHERNKLKARILVNKVLRYINLTTVFLLIILAIPLLNLFNNFILNR